MSDSRSSRVCGLGPALALSDNSARSVSKRTSSGTSCTNVSARARSEASPMRSRGVRTSGAAPPVGLSKAFALIPKQPGLTGATNVQALLEHWVCQAPKRLKTSGFGARILRQIEQPEKKLPASGGGEGGRGLGLRLRLGAGKPTRRNRGRIRRDAGEDARHHTLCVWC